MLPARAPEARWLAGLGEGCYYRRMLLPRAPEPSSLAKSCFAICGAVWACSSAEPLGQQRDPHGSRSVEAPSDPVSAAGAGPQLPEPDAGDTSADTEPEIEATPPLQIAGRWGMFYFEDPVAIDVQQDGSTLSGIGCCGGLEEDSDTSTYCCGELRGQVRGNQASFSFLLGLVGGSYDYEVIISSDATRMSGSATDAAGTLFQSSWLRLREGERLLSESGSWAMSTDPRNGGYTIKPTNPSAWFDFDGSYEFVFTASGMLLGDLGVFHETEFVDAEDTATFGPVPATQPSMPVQIVMQHDQRSIRSLAATMPDGEIVEFEVTSFRP